MGLKHFIGVKPLDYECDPKAFPHDFILETSKTIRVSFERYDENNRVCPKIPSFYPGFKRESLFLRKIVLGIRAQAIGKSLTRLIIACGAPAVLLLAFYTQRGE